MEFMVILKYLSVNDSLWSPSVSLFFLLSNFCCCWFAFAHVALSSSTPDYVWDIIFKYFTEIIWILEGCYHITNGLNLPCFCQERVQCFYHLKVAWKAPLPTLPLAFFKLFLSLFIYSHAFNCQIDYVKLKSVSLFKDLFLLSETLHL